jgi:hypothetical protein
VECGFETRMVATGSASKSAASRISSTGAAMQHQ